MADRTISRRQAIGRSGAVIAASVSAAAAAAQAPAPSPQVTGRPTVRLVPRGELVNVLEYEDQARRLLPADTYALIAGGERAPFDRVTVHPRMLVRTTNLDLSLTVVGQPMFAPILIGPVAGQQRFHPEGELATVRGASAAQAVTIVSSGSTTPLAQLIAASTTPLWYQVFARDAGAAGQIRQAVTAGVRAICITVGAQPSGNARTVATTARIDWPVVGSLVRAASVPVFVKGISTLEAADAALQRGAQGLILSNYGGLTGGSREPLILRVAAIADAVNGRVPLLVDGSFRRGTDVLKALAFGATAVVVARPVMWGLAAYGAEGVQGVVEMLQTELARYMAMSGRPTLAAVDRALVRVHRESAAP
jgi:4-hydroxymandelate oxidase